MNKTGSSLVGNARFEGYIIDLLDRLAAKADFSYNIKLVSDDAYGIKSDSGHWNGMVREVKDSVSNQ